jgi:peptide-methionine (S)-S-oxide reductase
VVSYEHLLEEFWRHHDPTTSNRQGRDVGTQYRSAVFFHDAEQERQARQSLKSYQERFGRPIVTEVVPATTFWPAEAYHQRYVEPHRARGVPCGQLVAAPLRHRPARS